MEDHVNYLTTAHFVFLSLSWAIFQPEVVIYVIIYNKNRLQILSLLLWIIVLVKLWPHMWPITERTLSKTESID